MRQECILPGHQLRRSLASTFRVRVACMLVRVVVSPVDYFVAECAFTLCTGAVTLGVCCKAVDEHFQPLRLTTRHPYRVPVAIGGGL